MRIRFLQSIACSRWSYDAGDIVECNAIPPDLRPFLDGIRAELVRDEPADETATLATVGEIAVIHRGKARARA